MHDPVLLIAGVLGVVIAVARAVTDGRHTRLGWGLAGVVFLAMAMIGWLGT